MKGRMSSDFSPVLPTRRLVFGDLLQIGGELARAPVTEDWRAGSICRCVVNVCYEVELQKTGQGAMSDPQPMGADASVARSHSDSLHIRSCFFFSHPMSSASVPCHVCSVQTTSAPRLLITRREVVKGQRHSDL